MIKKFLGLALIAAAALVPTMASAQTLKEGKQACVKEGVCLKQNKDLKCKDAVRPVKGDDCNKYFEGITLTPEQQTKIAAIQAQCKAERKAAKQQAKAERCAKQKEAEAQIQAVLTPEQFAQFQANKKVAEQTKLTQKKHGDKKCHKDGKKGKKDGKKGKKGKKDLKFECTGADCPVPTCKATNCNDCSQYPECQKVCNENNCTEPCTK